MCCSISFVVCIYFCKKLLAVYPTNVCIIRAAQIAEAMQAEGGEN